MLSLLVAGFVRAADAPAADAEAEAEKALIEFLKGKDDFTNSLGMVLVAVNENLRAAKFETTQAIYEKVMGENPSRSKGPQRPVDRVTWTQAGEFCKRLTEMELKDRKLPKGYAYALPTEGQWESCVGDATLKTAITSELGDRRNSENVGGLAPNSLGLHDVRGNVWEWCSTPVARGASWQSHSDYLATSFRFAGEPDTPVNDVGFRVVLQLPAGP